MRQLFLDKSNVIIKDMAQSLMDDHAVLIAVHYAYICARTQINHLSNEENIFANVPHKVKRALEAVAYHVSDASTSIDSQSFSLGNACSGYVVSVGKKVQRFVPGDLVACADPSYNAYADLVCVPEHLVVKVTDKENSKVASLTSIAAVALQGVRRSEIQLGETAAVFGLGLIGQITIQLLKNAGCNVIAVGSTPERLELAKKSGADHILHFSQDAIIKEIGLITQRFGVDSSFVTAHSDSDAIIAAAMNVTRKKGKVVVVGDVPISISPDQLYTKELDFLVAGAYEPYNPSSESCEAMRWPVSRNMQACLQLIEQKKLNLSHFIQDEIGPDHIKEAYRLIKNKSVMGVLLAYPQISGVPTLSLTKIKSTSASRFFPAKSDVIKVGITGSDAAVEKSLLSLVVKQKNVKITAAMGAGFSYGSHHVLPDLAKLYTKEDEFFNDTTIDVVLVTGASHAHMDYVIRALEHNKAVLVTQSLVTDMYQLKKLSDYLTLHPSAPLMAAYHRTYSPFIQKIKKVVAKRITPLMMHYRTNIGYGSHEERIRSQVGAGRIITEASQVIDIFCYLTQATPVSVSVESVHAARNDIFPTDNFTAHISFDDGSVADLLFSSLGHPDLGRERMEIFFDEKSIVMEDYMELYGFGFHSWFNETITTADQGYEALVSSFFHGLKKETDFQTNVSRLLMGAELTLLIDQLACEGGGKKDL